MNFLREFFQQVRQTLLTAIQGFGNQKLNVIANHLTYSLLFAIVPILALVFAFAKGFGFSYLIDQQMEQYTFVSSEWVNTFTSIINRYIETSNRGLFIGVGLVILIGAVYIFFRNVELAFNEIWNVKQSRSISRQSLNYIAVLFLIPVLIVVTSGLNIYLHTAAESWDMFDFLAPYRDSFLNFIQFILLTAIFTWMYMAIPNTKVHFKSGCIPGVITSLLLMLIETFSVYLMVLLSRMSIVYGAFAFIPIMLVIIKWLCLIILIGAELSYAIQNNEDMAYQHDLQTMSRRYKDFLTIYLLCIVIRCFEKEEQPLTARELATQVGIPVRQATLLLTRLESCHLVRELYIEGKEDKVFQPACDTHTITLSKVLDKLDQQGSEDFIVPVNDKMQQLWKSFTELKHTLHTSQNIYINQLDL